MSHHMAQAWPAPVPLAGIARLEEMFAERERIASGRRSAGYPPLPARVGRALRRPRGRYKAGVVL